MPQAPGACHRPSVRSEYLLADTWGAGWVGGRRGRTAMKSTFGLEGAATLLLVSAPPERTIAAIVPIALA